MSRRPRGRGLLVVAGVLLFTLGGAMPDAAAAASHRPVGQVAARPMGSRASAGLAGIDSKPSGVAGGLVNAAARPRPATPGWSFLRTARLIRAAALAVVLLLGLWRRWSRRRNRPK